MKQIFDILGKLSGKRRVCDTYAVPVAYQSKVEHSAVNRVVAGSSPARGAKESP